MHLRGPIWMWMRGSRTDSVLQEVWERVYQCSES